MLERFPQGLAFLFGNLADGFGAVQIGRIQDGGDQRLRNEFAYGFRQGPFPVFLEIAQDAGIELFFVQGGLQVQDQVQAPVAVMREARRRPAHGQGDRTGHGAARE